MNFLIKIQLINSQRQLRFYLKNSHTSQFKIFPHRSSCMCCGIMYKELRCHSLLLQFRQLILANNLPKCFVFIFKMHNTWLACLNWNWGRMICCCCCYCWRRIIEFLWKRKLNVILQSAFYPWNVRASSIQKVVCSANIYSNFLFITFYSRLPLLAFFSS